MDRLRAREWRPPLGSAATIAIVAAVLIPLLGAWQVLRTREALLLDGEQNARTLSHALAQHVARTIEGVDLVLSSVVERLEGDPDRTTLKAYLERRAGQIQQANGVAATDARGQWVADSFPPHVAIDTSDRPYFSWHREHPDRTLHISDIVQSRLLNAPVIPVSRRYNAPDGSFGGVVVTALKPDYLQAFYDSLEIGPGGAVTLYGADGRILVRHPAAPAFIGRDMSQAPGAGPVLHQHSGLGRSKSPVDGRDRLYAFEHVDKYPLIVAAAIAVDDVLGPWRHEATRESLVLALASLCLIGLAIGLEGHRRQAAEQDRISRDADRRYRLLAENSGDLITLKPNFAGLRCYVSPSSTMIVGWSPEEFAALPVQDYVHPDDLDRVAAVFDGLTPAEPRARSFYRVRHKQGHYIWIEATIQLTHSGAPDESIVVAARDVTERLAFEEALKESEARYRLLADFSSDMVTRVGLDRIRHYVSPASTEITGYTPEELIGTPTDAFIHPDDIADVEAEIEALRSGRTDRGRSIHRLRHKLGHWVWVEIRLRLARDPLNGTPTSIVSSMRDVTQREELRREVESGVCLLSATLACMEQGLVVLSGAGGLAVVNRRACTLLGLPSEAVAKGLGPGRSDAMLLDRKTYSWLFEPDGGLKTGPFIHQLDDGRLLEVRPTPMPEGETLLTFSDITEIKRAETDLKAANRLMRMAEEIAHVGHWRLDLPSRRVTWSDEVYRIHGVVKNSFRLDHAATIGFYHPDDRAEVERCVEEALTRRQGFVFNLRIRRSDGALRWVLSRGICEIDPASGAVIGLFGAVMDVTDLTEAQRQLAEKSANLEATLENIDQGLVKVGADGAIELANRRYADLLDLPPEVLAGPRRPWRDVLAYLDGRGEFTRMDEAGQARVRTAPFTPGTFTRPRSNGQMLEVRVAPLPDASVLVTYTDITARRRAESALQESEARYRMLADATSDVITQVDLALKLRYVSPASRTVLGYEPQAMIRMRPLALVHPEDVTPLRTLAGELAASRVEGDRATATFRMRHAAGHWVWLEAGVNLVREAGTGAPQSLIGALRDVTERQRTARHLERAKAAAERAARLKADFVANMSHELRTPLTGILGIHDLLRNDPTLGRQHRHYIDLAFDAGRSLLTIVNDVLDFSKIEAGQLAIEKIPFDLGELIEACRDFGRHEAAAKALSIRSRLVGGPVTLLGDPNRLRQILLNLITNAVKFSERGSISIEAGYDAELGRLRVSVTDPGIGIAQDKLPLLFDRFSQADTSITRRYGGTGLGLAICKRLVDLMGGRIGVQSLPAQGSTFWFDVPLSMPTEAAPGSSPASLAPKPPSRRLLLAEDNRLNQEIIAAMLEQAGHQVTVVDDGAAAVAAARRERYDMILLDLQMPVMDGLSAARAIRGAEAETGAAATPIIGLTANAMAEDIERCRQAGMDGHVAKPIEWAELFDTIDRLLKDGRGPSPEWRPPVLDDKKLEELATFIGRERLASMLTVFVTEVDQRVLGLDLVAWPEVSARAHALMSLAGHFGFVELARVCADIEDDVRKGCGLRRFDDLLAAANRAKAAALACVHGRAA